MTAEAPNPKPPPKPSLQEIFLMVGAFAGLVYAMGWLSRFVALSDLGLGQFGSTKEKALAAGILVTLMICPATALVAFRKKGFRLPLSLGIVSLIVVLIGLFVFGLTAMQPESALDTRIAAGAVAALICVALIVAVSVMYSDLKTDPWPVIGGAMVPILVISSLCTAWLFPRLPEAVGGIRRVAGEIELKDNGGTKKGYLLEADGDFVSIVVPNPPMPAEEGTLLIIPKGEVKQIRITDPLPYGAKLGLPPQPN